MEAFRDVRPVGALGTLLMDWIEGVSYSYFRSGLGMREVPFFLHGCVR